jgi:hypothetical protein
MHGNHPKPARSGHERGALKNVRDTPTLYVVYLIEMNRVQSGYMMGEVLF